MSEGSYWILRSTDDALDAFAKKKPSVEPVHLSIHLPMVVQRKLIVIRLTAINFTSPTKSAETVQMKQASEA